MPPDSHPLSLTVYFQICAASPKKSHLPVPVLGWGYWGHPHCWHVHFWSKVLGITVQSQCIRGCHMVWWVKSKEAHHMGNFRYAFNSFYYFIYWTLENLHNSLWNNTDLKERIYFFVKIWNFRCFCSIIDRSLSASYAGDFLLAVKLLVRKTLTSS